MTDDKKKRKRIKVKSVKIASFYPPKPYILKEETFDIEQDDGSQFTYDRIEKRK
jgi:hypothetical protein